MEKENRNSKKKKRYLDERQTQTHRSLTDIFDNHRCPSQSEESKSM